MRYVDEQTAYEQFDGFLDEAHPVIEILGMSYNPSTVLKECDPIAYRCTFNYWCDDENITTDESEADDEEDDNDYYYE